jgi:predicted MPP superfamily phosphohydrolase
LLLLGLALIAGYGRWTFSILVFGFFLLDWIALELLPKAGISFGPARPPVLILAIMRFPFALLPAPIAIPLQVLGTVLVIYAFWIEPLRLTVTRQEITSAKLPPEFHLKVLHLGDLHIERITRREQDLNRFIKELSPDLILFSGDVLNLSFVEDPIAIDHARQVIRAWEAPLGTYFVSGSEAVDLAHVFPGLIHELPVHWLQRETIILEKDHIPFAVTGLSCSHRPFRDAPILKKLASETAKYFSIFLYHSPDMAPNAAQMGYDLQLSGHTHGGQICLPFWGPLFTASLYGRRFQSGRYSINHMILYITRGIGLEGKAAPRARFLCPPELILWNINGTTANRSESR